MKRIFIAGSGTMGLKMVMRMEQEDRKDHPCEYCGKPTTNKKYCRRSCVVKAKQEAADKKFQEYLHRISISKT